MPDSDGPSEFEPAQGTLFEEEAPPPADEECDAWSSGPPTWFAWSWWAVMGGTALALALVVMVQWAVLLVLTSQIWSPWGMVLGVAVVAAQILALFEKRESEDGCTVPSP